MNPFKSTVFILVPGAWHSTDYLEPMRTYLQEVGYDSIAVGHQRLDPINPGSSVYDDAAKLEKVVMKRLEAGQDVIVVMHSYGGSVGSEAIGHLLSTAKSTPSDDDSNSAGKMGRLLHLVYVAALIPQKGQTSADLGELIATINPNKETLPLDKIDGKLVCKEGIKELFYGDLPESARAKYYNLLRRWPATDEPDALTHFGWKYVPSTYVCALNDRVVSLKVQDQMWTKTNEALLEVGGLITANRRTSPAGSVDSVGQKTSHVPELMKVEFIDSDHCSMFILRKHVELLGSMLVAISVSENRNK